MDDHTLLQVDRDQAQVVVTDHRPGAVTVGAHVAAGLLQGGWLVGGDRLVIRTGGGAVVNVGLEEIDSAWRSGFERHMA